MAYLHDNDQPTKFAHAAMAAMETHGVPPTPENFTVWYNYCADAMPDLVRTINGLLGQRRQFDETRNTQLYARFFDPCREGEMIHATGAKVEEAISHIMEFVGEASGNAEMYGTRLADLSGALTPAIGVHLPELHVVVAGILQHTHQMAQQNRMLEERLNTAAETVRELRANLAEVRREAMTDGLTGVANRKCFDRSLRKLASEAVESREPLSLLMIDIDHFKRFNDSFGHQMGDQVLKFVARALTQCVKGRDVVARYGGEEFAVILPWTQLVHAVTVAQQIRNTLGNKKIVKRSTGEDLGCVTVSIGVAQFECGEPVNDLVARGDHALYCAKRTGRNRVMTQDEVSGELAASA